MKILKDISQKELVISALSTENEKLQGQLRQAVEGENLAKKQNDILLKQKVSIFILSFVGKSNGFEGTAADYWTSKGKRWAQMDYWNLKFESIFILSFNIISLLSKKRKTKSEERMNKWKLLRKKWDFQLIMYTFFIMLFTYIL